MSHTRRAGHPSDRWSTGLQLHQRCYQQWSRGRFFHFFFTAVESQLGERQDWSQLIHGGFCENHLITGYSKVWSLDWELRGRGRTFHRDVGNKKPASWKKNVKIKSYFIKVLHSVKSIRMAVLIAKLDVRASIYPRKFGSHVTVPPSAQQGNQY